MNANALIYHGGGQPRSCFASNGVDGKTQYSLSYGNATGISTPEFISASNDFSGYPCSGMGHYIPVASHIIATGALCTRFTSFGAGTLTLRIRYHNPADGSKGSCQTANAGTLVDDILVNFPNSGGGFQYYCGGGQAGQSWAVPSDSMLYVYAAINTINTITGVVVWMTLEVD